MNRFVQARLCLAHRPCCSQVEYVNQCLKQFRDDLPLEGEDDMNADDPRIDKLVVEPNIPQDEFDHPFVTKIYMNGTYDCSMEMDLSDQIFGFNPMFLIYMKDIAEIDVSGCVQIPVIDFVDCLPACKNLKVLNMKACKQFSELHLIQMIPQLKNLNSLCLEECQEISYPVAFWIVSALPKLFQIDFEPKNREIELKDWKRLFHTFFRVQFGVAFRRILPNYGAYVRIPATQ